MSENLIFYILLFVSVVCADGQQLTQKLPDVGLNVKQLIEKYGYPFENHTLQTEDGYLIEIHRIPHGSYNKHLKNKPAVLLVPGLLSSSVDWVNMGPERGLGFILADHGYDVWLANYRGTTWSRKHVTLNPDTDKKKFWNYSFHEIAIFDIKKFVDYILNITKQEKIFYIGHSQGTACLLILVSENPQYNNKIRLGILLAPTAYPGNVKSSLIRLFVAYKDEVEAFSEKHQYYEILPHYPVITLLGQIFCNDDSPFQNICASIFYLAAGYSPKQMNKTMIPVITSNTPAGSSIKQLLHYAQLVISDSFQQYDYGKAENLVRYGQPTPPDYNVTSITNPLVFYYGTRDILCAEKDVDRLAARVPNVVLNRRIRGFNHLDYMWGIDTVTIIFKEILEIMQRY